MRNFKNFINENNDDRNTMIDTIHYIVSEVGTIDCDVIIGDNFTIKSIYISENDNSLLMTRFYLDDLSNRYALLDNFNLSVIENIYDYLMDAYKDDEKVGYLFTGKDMGLL